MEMYTMFLLSSVLEERWAQRTISSQLRIRARYNAGKLQKAQLQNRELQRTSATSHNSVNDYVTLVLEPARASHGKSSLFPLTFWNLSISHCR